MIVIANQITKAYLMNYITDFEIHFISVLYSDCLMENTIKSIPQFGFKDCNGIHMDCK